MTAPLAYYNEVDPYAAQMLRNLIAAGEIPFGVVDERGIRDVQPANLEGFAQCHFFAGVGIWARALRCVGWPDDRPVWTGSCPCQPFSAAGKGAGMEDERHLWPDWHWLIEQCRPETVFGEQVASHDGLVWAELVSADLEATGYAFGAVDTCAAGFGGYHIRQRLYFAAERDGMADADGRDTGAGDWPGILDRIWRCADGRVDDTRRAGSQGFGGDVDDRGQSGWIDPGSDRSAAPAGGDDGLGHPARGGRDGGAGFPDTSAGRGRAVASNTIGDGGLADASSKGSFPAALGSVHRREKGAGTWDGEFKRSRGPDRVADADRGAGAEHELQPGERTRRQTTAPDSADRPGHLAGVGDNGVPSPIDIIGAPADWLFGRDGKWRPVEPGTFPLADAAAGRVGRLRAYGNGLDLGQAAGFIHAYLERELGSVTAVAENLFEWVAQ